MLFALNYLQKYVLVVSKRETRGEKCEGKGGFDGKNGESGMHEAGRASPAVRADEDVHNPSVGGLLYVSGAGGAYKTDFYVTTRGLRRPIRSGGF